MNLEELRRGASHCTACDLALRRRNVVFGEGDPTSPLVLIGEGPGETEDLSGRPFVGKAGKLLDQALFELGLSRADVYICNTVKCRACDWSSGKPVNRPPTPFESATCRQWLLPQLAQIGPEVILCIGALSARNLINKNFKITAERGQWFSSEVAPHAIATLHPSYIQRCQSATSDGGYSLFVSDIQAAWERASLIRTTQSL